MGKKDSDSEVTQRTEIPGFLQPFVKNQARVGSTALTNLEALLGNAGAGDLVAGFDPLQEQGFDLAVQRAQGAGGFLPTAQNAFLETAQGVDPSTYIDPAAYGALQSTASGDFLFGGQGFDAAVDAAVRAAAPGILSTFGGAGGAPGGLARTAIGKAATDAFAGQYGQERANQLSASSLLADIAGGERGRSLAAAGALPALATADAGILQQIGGIRQGQAQRELTAPISAQEGLISAAGGGIPLSALLGSSQTQQGGGGSNLFNDIAGGALALAPFLFL
jgi:hypothetical protein